MKRSTAVTCGVAALAAYYAAFIARTSFTIGATRYFPLLDDAMVSMRYARHLVQGHGFAWNLGDPPLEGFTNPLWTLVMAAVHLAPLPHNRYTLVVQGIGAAILLAMLVTVFRLAAWLAQSAPPPAARGDAKPASAIAPALVAMLLAGFYWPLTYWTLEGMEVGLLALIATIAAAALVTGRRPVLAYGLLAVGTFVRTDFVVVLLAFAVAGALLAEPGRRRAPLTRGVAIAVACVGVQTLARILYFHDPLPNTYYLKLTGYPAWLRVTRGAWVLLQTIVLSKGLLLLLPAAGIALEQGAARRRQLLLLTPLFAQAAYSVWVGGDAWEGTIPCNR